MDKSGWQNLKNTFNDLHGLFWSWLDSLDEQNKSLHLFMMMGLLVMVLGLAGCHSRLSHNIEQYENANLQLAQTLLKRQQDLENFQLQEKRNTETRTQLKSLRALLDKAQAPATVLLELANIIPAHARIIKLVQHGDSLNLEGKSRSNSEVVEFLQSLSTNAIFQDPLLISLKQSTTKSEQQEDFELKVRWKPKAIGVFG